MLKVGQVVTAKITAQGVRKGQQYKVITVNPQVTAFGTFYTYRVEHVSPIYRTVAVANADFLFEAEAK